MAGHFHRQKCVSKDCKKIVRKKGEYCLDCYCKEVSGESYNEAVCYEARGIGVSGWVDSIGEKVI